MKALRTIGILVLVAGLMLSSVGTVFAGGPPEGTPGKVPKFQGQKRGFCGNVTLVTNGNVTILTKLGNVTLMLTEETRYKIPTTVMNKWGNLTEFEGQLEGGLSALVDRRVVALAGNVTGAPLGPFAGQALKFMLLPELGVQGPALHAHRTGLVSKFSYNGGGNITIIDIHGVSHTFDLAADMSYRPKELGEVPEPEEVIGHFVTVVIKGDPKLVTAEAKAIVVHHRIPEGWPTP